MTTARRILRWGVRIVLGSLAFVALLLMVGAGYQAVAGNVDRTRYPPPGRLVDIGGASLHLYCTGHGSPTVVLEAGLGLGLVTWREVQPQVSQVTRACSYDRAGYGWSDPGPLPRTSSRIAAELEALLDRAGVPGPYVLVGHSLGGLYARHFASMHLADVAGMVLVDSTHERQGAAPSLVLSLTRAAHFVGVRRLLFRFGDDGLNAMYTSNHSSAAANEEFAAAAASFDEVQRVNSSLGDRPLVVITAGQSDEGEWRALQLDLLTRSTNSRRLVAEGSGHYVHDDRPALVIDAIREVVVTSRRFARR